MKCYNCNGEVLNKKEQMMRSTKALKQLVLPKTCYNCGKPPAARQSMRSMKPRGK